MKIKRILKVSVLLLISALLLCSCAKAGDFTVNKKIVCEVGKVPITYDEYKYFFYSHHTDLYGADSTDYSAEKFAEVVKRTEDSLRRRAVIMGLIDKYEVKLDDETWEYVDTVVNAQIETYEGEEGYKNFLLEGRATGRVFRDQILLTFGYDPALRDVFKMGVNPDIVVTDEAMLKAVGDGRFYHYEYQFFSLAEGKNSEKLKVEAEEFLAGLKAGTAAFSKNSDEYDAIGQKTKAFEDAVLALAEGEVSEVLWGADWAENAGYYVFRRLPIDIEQAKAGMDRYEIEDEYFASTYLKYISDLSKSVKIEYSKYFKTLDYQTFVKKEELN